MIFQWPFTLTVLVPNLDLKIVVLIFYYLLSRGSIYLGGLWYKGGLFLWLDCSFRYLVYEMFLVLVQYCCKCKRNFKQIKINWTISASFLCNVLLNYSLQTITKYAQNQSLSTFWCIKHYLIRPDVINQKINCFNISILSSTISMYMKPM